jgi:hypothetical protein
MQGLTAMMGEMRIVTLNRNAVRSAVIRVMEYDI